MPKLTQAQLESIRQRVENATPGPWQIATTTDGAYVLDTDGMIIAATVERTEDATFIAHARTDIPALLDHIAGLEAELEKYRKILHGELRIVVKKNDVPILDLDGVTLSVEKPVKEGGRMTINKDNIDKVRELHEWARTTQKKFAKVGKYTKADARMDGILLTLDALGIKIEGVND
jgi:hypothetical protein